MQPTENVWVRPRALREQGLHVKRRVWVDGNGHASSIRSLYEGTPIQAAFTSAIFQSESIETTALSIGVLRDGVQLLTTREFVLDDLVVPTSSPVELIEAS
jgi:hypothetical protein